ncbi:MAG: hypothetical protein HFJ35_02050 [Clostridia bacterium]|nr:hypothetical protein [Clostridia bacterium]
MIDSSISHCSNENCSKKDKCLRYTERRNVKYGQTYISLTEEQCEKNNCYINVDEYNKKMIMDIINKVPQDELDKKLILESCNSLLSIAKKYDLEIELKERIKQLENK